MKIARPGNVPIHHHWKYCVPSATIEPHSACGGCAPSPRNERPGEQQDRGRQVERRQHEHRPGDVRQHVADERAAGTRAEQPSRLDVLACRRPSSTSPRTTRAYGGHATITIASAAFWRPRPSTAATTIARMIGGKANTRSVPRMQRPSSDPRK